EVGGSGRLSRSSPCATDIATGCAGSATGGPHASPLARSSSACARSNSPALMRSNRTTREVQPRASIRRVADMRFLALDRDLRAVGGSVSIRIRAAMKTVALFLLERYGDAYEAGSCDEPVAPAEVLAPGRATHWALAIMALLSTGGAGCDEERLRDQLREA